MHLEEGQEEVDCWCVCVCPSEHNLPPYTCSEGTRCNNGVCIQLVVMCVCAGVLMYVLECICVPQKGRKKESESVRLLPYLHCLYIA